jgi:hypothetical protein
MLDEDRKEWLSTLQVSSRVVVKTQIKSYDGVVEHIEDDKIWVIYPIDRYGSGVINVNLSTGENRKARISIFPFID